MTSRPTLPSSHSIGSSHISASNERSPVVRHIFGLTDEFFEHCFQYKRSLRIKRNIHNDQHPVHEGVAAEATYLTLTPNSTRHHSRGKRVSLMESLRY
ncbi:hypothetical protein K7432_014001 [Basidiobolus ranarum]|uniref:Uncharacterized protein n=1 Tax=Basidiobolus ranarum TaxID=34480 RepID=A0ABR2VQ18_9FUNG